MKMNSANVEYGGTLNMKRLPESELELMLIIWHAGEPITRIDIEKQLSDDRNIGATTILSFLSRLQEKGYVDIVKKGKNNLYTPKVKEKEYLQKESKSILKKIYQNSIKNFVTALYDGDSLTENDLEELQKFIDEKKAGR